MTTQRIESPDTNGLRIRDVAKWFTDHAASIQEGGHVWIRVDGVHVEVMAAEIDGDGCLVFDVETAEVKRALR